MEKHSNNQQRLSHTLKWLSDLLFKIIVMNEIQKIISEFTENAELCSDEFLKQWDCSYCCWKKKAEVGQLCPTCLLGLFVSKLFKGIDKEIHEMTIEKIGDSAHSVIQVQKLLKTLINSVK